MMLIIADKSPYKAVDYLVKYTDKNFVFKQLLELGQLVCSCGISNVYKPVKQGKELQEWVKKYKHWTLRYFIELFDWAKTNLELKSETIIKLSKIHEDLCRKTYWIDIPEIAIFRYVKEYSEFTDYETNSELPIDVAVEEYKKYLDWKFKKKEI